MKTKVFIYAACDVFYGSFYIKGLADYFGKANVRFSGKKFPAFKQNTFAFIIENGSEKKVVIDFYDSPEIDKAAYDWCDVYGKINLTEADSRAFNKTVPIGPGFGIKIWPMPMAVLAGMYHFLLCYKRLDRYKKFFSNYKSQALRLDIGVYKKTVSEKDYVFVLNSLWRKEAVTNRNRAKFIEACKAIPNLKFEGGFAPRARKDVAGFEEYTTEKRYGLKDYLEKLKRSAVAFNTPAVFDCHGWKLGEFFALGKAIITTPISRVLPEKLVDNVQAVILPQDADDYKPALQALLSNDGLRAALENNALEYYNKYLKPAKVIERLVAY